MAARPKAKKPIDLTRRAHAARLKEIDALRRVARGSLSDTKAELKALQRQLDSTWPAHEQKRAVDRINFLKSQRERLGNRLTALKKGKNEYVTTYVEAKEKKAAKDARSLRRKLAPWKRLLKGVKKKPVRGSLALGAALTGAALKGLWKGAKASVALAKRGKEVAGTLITGPRGVFKTTRVDVAAEKKALRKDVKEHLAKEQADKDAAAAKLAAEKAAADELKPDRGDANEKYGGLNFASQMGKDKSKSRYATNGEAKPAQESKNSGRNWHEIVAYSMKKGVTVQMTADHFGVSKRSVYDHRSVMKAKRKKAPAGKKAPVRKSA